MAKLRLNKNPILSSLMGLFVTINAASAAPFDRLVGVWEGLDSMTTMGQCISAPAEEISPYCAAFALADLKEGSLRGDGFLSATESVLEVSEAIRKKTVTSGDVQKIFEKYNYTDLASQLALAYQAKNYMLGVRPLRFQGQFQAHNFNLPYVSFSFRDDADFFAAGGWKKDWQSFTFRVGLMGTYIFRDESLLESSVADLASRPIKQIMLTQKSRGVFFDSSARLEFKETIVVAFLLKNRGKFSRPSLLREDMLYLTNDKDPLNIYSLGFLPKIGLVQFQFGIGLVQFPKKANSYKEQWFATWGLFLGPLRLYTGFRPGLMRTGLSFRHDWLEVFVMEEWVNRLEPGRIAQPRFTLGVGAKL